jgi:predicted DNA-binding protein (MmcQ/YjbR family)
MHIEAFQQYCLNKKGVTEEYPFGNLTMVMKVMGKMFALANLDGELSLNLKCDPEKAIELRERYSAVQPGYHMNKQHWNTLYMDGSIPVALVKEWIDDSYNLIVNSLTKKLQVQLEELKER